MRSIQFGLPKRSGFSGMRCVAPFNVSGSIKEGSQELRVDLSFNFRNDDMGCLFLTEAWDRLNMTCMAEEKINKKVGALGYEGIAQEAVESIERVLSGRVLCFDMWQLWSLSRIDTDSEGRLRKQGATSGRSK